MATSRRQKLDKLMIIIVIIINVNGHRVCVCAYGNSSVCIAIQIDSAKMGETNRYEDKKG